MQRRTFCFRGSCWPDGDGRTGAFRSLVRMIIYSSVWYRVQLRFFCVSLSSLSRIRFKAAIRFVSAVESKDELWPMSK